MMGGDGERVRASASGRGGVGAPGGGTGPCLHLGREFELASYDWLYWF